MEKGLYKFEVGHINDKGNFVPFKEYSYDGKIFIEARDNSKFSIRISNDSWYRIESVISVDGLSIINGKKATNDSIGYVINGLSNAAIDGWRVSNEQVSEFVFSNKKKSLSAETGYGIDDVGVISCRIFKEKQYYTTYTQIPYTFSFSEQHPKWDNGGTGTRLYGNTTTDAVNCFYSSNTVSLNEKSNFKSKSLRREIKSEEPNFDMGTSWGKNVESKVREVSFEREYMTQEFNIYYGSRIMLANLGIELDKEYKINKYPNGFADDKYCDIPYKK
jgi:hypothetical protein